MSLSYFFPRSVPEWSPQISRWLMPMNIDYATLEQDMESGELRTKLAGELTTGFRLMQEAGDAIPPASYYATKITEIIHSNAEQEMSKDLAYYLYQEVLLACEEARANVLGKPGE